MELEAPSGKVGLVEDSEIVCASLEAPDQFDLIFTRHHAAIWRYLARVSGRARADDLAGDVFVAAFSTRSRYDESRGSVRTWLYGIAANLTRSRLRLEGREARALGRAASRELPAALSADLVDNRIVSQDRLSAVLTAMERLSDVDQEMLVLFVWEGLSYDEIASALGIEVGTVRSRLSRARARLRELARLSGELTDDPR